VTRLVDVQTARGHAHLVLTGGGSGVACLACLRDSPARDAIDWSALDIWWGDERFLPTGHADRNATQAREALMALYGGQDSLSKAFRQGADSRLRTAQDLTREMQAADNGAAPPALLVQDARNLGTLMRQERRLRIGFLSAGGWDTHANQGAATGQLAGRLGNLGAALAQLSRDFDQPGDVVVVASEFGRTAQENGTRGTDHGHGNAMWLIGPGVAGGRWWGEWSGLAAANLHEQRDVPVHHDFRAVLAQLLRPTFGLTDAQMADVLPDTRWDARLDGLLQLA
jgi:uncharacterized protein (DUF1501 family)